MRNKAEQGGVARRRRDERRLGRPDARFTVGPVQENAYIVRRAAPRTRCWSIRAMSPSGCLDAIEDLGVEIEAILITHCHFDHIGAVAPLARATGAPVYCPEIERPVLEDISAGSRRGSVRLRATCPSTRSPAASG